jgi:hypothetical protein
MGLNFSTEENKLTLDLLPCDIQCEIGKRILSEHKLDKSYNYQKCIHVYQNPNVKFSLYEASYCEEYGERTALGYKNDDSSERVYVTKFIKTYTFYKQIFTCR